MWLQVMNAELDDVFGAMALGAVPALWKAQSYATLKPLGSYVNDLLARLGMFADWCASPLHSKTDSFQFKVASAEHATRCVDYQPDVGS